jgi:hypothetical protein
VSGVPASRFAACRSLMVPVRRAFPRSRGPAAAGGGPVASREPDGVRALLGSGVTAI